MLDVDSDFPPHSLSLLFALFTKAPLKGPCALVNMTLNKAHGPLKVHVPYLLRHLLRHMNLYL